MLDETVAARYAEALYELARQDPGPAFALRELEDVARTLAGHAALNRALRAPTVPAQVKKAILKRLLEPRVRALILHFLYLLVDKRREAYLEAIVEAFRRKLRDEQGLVRCRVEVAAPLTTGTRDRLLERLSALTGKKVELEVVVRPEILGGAVLTVGDRLIDGSLRRQLEDLRERLSAQVR
ncbi:MAG TPA: ATP synthase F1 subunit delta [Candidatus Nitrosotenuis sp.]|nr:ATP synthase F1 subunit delta [Candidatus Nitrosotenuis sp.]